MDLSLTMPMVILKFLENHEEKFGRWTDLAVRQFNKPSSWVTVGWGQRPQVIFIVISEQGGDTHVFLLNIYFTFNFMYTRVGICVWVQCPWKPEGGIRFRELELQVAVNWETNLPSARAGVFVTAKPAVPPQAPLSMEYLLCHGSGPFSLSRAP